MAAFFQNSYISSSTLGKDIDVQIVKAIIIIDRNDASASYYGCITDEDLP